VWSTATPSKKTPPLGRAARRLDTPLRKTVIYELHVKGFTKLHPEIPEELRGTYRGPGHPAAIATSSRWA
jgi:pullulanase/glycogen debranching enzyme